MHFFLRTAIIFSFFFLTGFSVNAQHTKTCDADHMTDLIKEKFPEHADAWEDFHQRVIPELVKNQPPAQLTAGEILRIPVVIHVIHTGEAVGTGANLSVAQIQAQLDILNEDFAAQNDNFNQTPAQWTSVIGNPNIQFCLANVDPAGNPSNGITRHNLTVTGTNTSDSNIEDEIKPPTTWNSNIYYNIWTLPIPGTSANGGTVGYAYLPNNFTIGSDFDGTVVDWRWFGGPGFNQSGYKTLTHETGHYLGLPHTFNDTDCSGDDNIEDTPNISAATASLIPGLSCSNDNFPTGPSSCGNEHMYVNYMDYVNSDYCYTSFTAGQIAVMRGVLEGDRPFNYGSRLALINNSNTACASAANNIGITSVAQPTAGTNCTPGPVTPQVTVGNFGTETVTTFSVSYQIDNGTLVSENFVDNIASGGTVTVSLPIFTPPANAYDFTVYTQNPNGVTDTQTDNDTTVVSSVLVTPQGLPLLEDFTAIQINPTAAGSYTFNPDADVFAWQRVPTSANGSAGGSILFDNYQGDSGNNPFGTIDAFISPVLDLSNSNSTTLTFDVAYARYENNGEFFNDSMRILISTDCGSNYNELVFNEGGATLETGTATVSAFTPSNNEWENRTIDLTNYDGQSSVSIAFVNVSGWGNRLFLDNINILEAENNCGLTANVVNLDVSCFGETDGIVQANPQGGTAPYTYLWSNQITDRTFSTGSGIYSVTITDATGCTATNAVEVFEPAPLSFGVNKTDETSAGANDGTADAVVSGGTLSYSFLWSTNETTPTITNLAPGNYDVTVTDANGCNNEVSFVIQPGQVICDLHVDATIINPECFGQDGLLGVSPSNGISPYTYLWSNDSTENIIVTEAGTYSLTITDATGCTHSGNLTIEEPETFSFILGTAQESVSGANDGRATVNINGFHDPADFSYNWSNGGTTRIVENLASGDYSVTVTNQNGCTLEESFTISTASTNCDLIANIVITDALCFQDPSGLAEVFPEGGTEPFSYLWDNQMTDPVIVSGAGFVSVTVTDANNCTAIVTGEILEPTLLHIDLSKTDETTAGANDGTATTLVSGGTGSDYSFNWSNNATTASVTNLVPNDYTVTVTDENGCTQEASFVILPGQADCSQLSLTLQPTAASCADSNNGSINAIPTGGSGSYQYAWSNGMSTQNINNLSSGTYQLTITDQMGCTLSKTTIVNAPVALTATISATESQTASAPPTGTATVNANGGTGNYTYQWSNGDNTATIIELSVGTYSVSVYDSNQCTWTGSVEVTEEVNDCSSLNLEITSNNISCFGMADGFIHATASGGSPEYIYQWNNGMNSANIVDLPAGIYQLTITDINGCSVVETTEITESTPLLANLHSNSDPCSVGGTVSVDPTGGIGGYQVSWSNGTSGFTNNVNQSGTYQVTITDGAGCTVTDAIDMTIVDTTLELIVSTENTSCADNNDGLAAATVAGGTTPYHYNWSTGSTENSIENLAAGTYSVEITDATGCQQNQIFTVTAPDPILLDCSGTPESNGVDGFVQVSVSGGIAPYQYIWSTGDTGSFVQEITNGSFDVTVTDQNGCSSICTVDLIPTNTEMPANFATLDVFPNPASEQLFIQANLLESESVNLSLVNLIGQAVWTANTNGTAIQQIIEVADLAAGTYLLRLETAKGSAVRKVVIF